LWDPNKRNRVLNVLSISSQTIHSICNHTFTTFVQQVGEERGKVIK
jgi:hypothetical protein